MTTERKRTAAAPCGAPCPRHWPTEERYRCRDEDPCAYRKSDGQTLHDHDVLLLEVEGVVRALRDLEDGLHRTGRLPDVERNWGLYGPWFCTLPNNEHRVFAYAREILPLVRQRLHLIAGLLVNRENEPPIASFTVKPTAVDLARCLRHLHENKPTAPKASPSVPSWPFDCELRHMGPHDGVVVREIVHAPGEASAAGLFLFRLERAKRLPMHVFDGQQTTVHVTSPNGLRWHFRLQWQRRHGWTVMARERM